MTRRRSYPRDHVLKTVVDGGREERVIQDLALVPGVGGHPIPPLRVFEKLVERNLDDALTRDIDANLQVLVIHLLRLGQHESQLPLYPYLPSQLSLWSQRLVQTGGRQSETSP